MACITVGWMYIAVIWLNGLIFAQSTSLFQSWGFLNLFEWPNIIHEIANGKINVDRDLSFTSSPLAFLAGKFAKFLIDRRPVLDDVALVCIYAAFVLSGSISNFKLVRFPLSDLYEPLLFA